MRLRADASVCSTEAVTTVYNLRVADHHTYFVGGTEWGWDVWVHNAKYQISPVGQLKQSDEGARSSLRRALGGVNANEQAHHVVPWELRDHPLVKLASFGGFGINSRANGVKLSTSTHLGSHPKYTTAVELALNNILKKVGNNPTLANLELQSYSTRVSRALLQTTAKLH